MRTINYEQLEKHIESKGILLDRHHKSTKLPAASAEFCDELAIFVDEEFYATENERRWALAHEFGHCETGSFYDINVTREEHARSEYRANSHAVDTMVSYEEYEEAVLSHCQTEYEFAEFWRIPIERVSIVHTIYERTRYDDVLKLKRIVLEMEE